CAVGLASSVMVTVPVAGPTTVGANFTLIVQLAPTATVVQVLVCVNEPPATATLLTVSVEVPLLVSVTVWAADVVFTTTPVKLSAVELSCTPGATAVPVRATVCGLEAALSEMESDAARAPEAVGL